MNTRNGATALGLIKAFLLAVSVATVARAGMAYLPLTGPAALRVLAVRPPPQIQTTVIAAKPPASATENCTNAIFPETVAASPATNSDFPLPPLTMGASTSILMASPDFLSVTPEMLAAYFTPAGIRRTSRRTALTSDSSYRFERGVDPAGVFTASALAVQLILETAGGTVDLTAVEGYADAWSIVASNGHLPIHEIL